MHRLELLGRIHLRDAGGNELRAVLAQPKRLALLAHLSLRAAEAPCRRDQLLALFWPELDQQRARKALNKAVHFLRQELGQETLTSRNADELALDLRRRGDGGGAGGPAGASLSHRQHPGQQLSDAPARRADAEINSVAISR